MLWEKGIFPGFVEFLIPDAHFDVLDGTIVEICCLRPFAGKKWELSPGGCQDLENDKREGLEGWGVYLGNTKLCELVIAGVKGGFIADALFKGVQIEYPRKKYKNNNIAVFT